MGLAASSHTLEPPALYRPRTGHSRRGFVDTVVARYLDCGVAESYFVIPRPKAISERVLVSKEEVLDAGLTAIPRLPLPSLSPDIANRLEGRVPLRHADGLTAPNGLDGPTSCFYSIPTL